MVEIEESILNDLKRLNELSPFEFKDLLIKLAGRKSDRIMLNAGRGNPNFLALEPRYAYIQLGKFALDEAERHFGYMRLIGGHCERDGIEARFEVFIRNHWEERGTKFLNSAVSYVRDYLGLSAGDFLCEMVQGYLGCEYPSPPRMLPMAEKIVVRYLLKEMGAGYELGYSIVDETQLFAVEGGTGAMAYLFESLRANHILNPGDKIALAVPIFSPYLEIPKLDTYRLVTVEVRADPEKGYQIPEEELEKLRDPGIKAFFLVNPGNPTAVKLEEGVLTKLKEIVESERGDLVIITDDVYATFAEGFKSVYSLLPHNTVLVYSFSKYFGATGWRLGVIGLHRENVLDELIANLPEEIQRELDERYAPISPNPRELKFMDRLVADSRNVALRHTAGLSTPQQVQMVLFALYSLMDEEEKYKKAVRRILRRRYSALYRGIGLKPEENPNCTYYYTLLDMEGLSERLYGKEFSRWFMENFPPEEFIIRLAKEAGVVLLPGKGFEVPHPSARVSLANLREVDYLTIGRTIRRILDEYYGEFTKGKRG
ncbi:bifunctional aspartate transaminase/aspartate 4-decarboxylase [Thermococcus sp.]|uniref:bifunctional aspartate transaminase/aspartate 4-decarboxylase n=1 Tax=Thermococcus sp. TaxID=35749 RepID=UPI002620F7AF|nr:bifunctional aspartate transaminase/aspartate 4-decarboxylase [Thermococcus sp.]